MKYFFVFFLLFRVSAASGEPLILADVPFWKSKPKVYKKILEERAIVVSVKTVDDKTVPTTPRVMRMLGGGMLNVPKDFAFRQAKNFKNLEKMSSHIKTAQWNDKTQTLFLHTEAFNYHARMHLQVSFLDTPAKSAILWKITAGVFTGMEGRIEFSPVVLPAGARGGGADAAEIALATGYRYAKFPIPAFFLEFGLEVVMQKIAGRMRSFIEEEYKRCHKGSAGDVQSNSAGVCP